MSITTKLKAIFGAQPAPGYNVIISPETLPSVEGLSARQLYATQANLHAVVSFLADSVAQLPLKVYERSDETDRRRDRDSTAAKLLYRPNADQTSYEFWNMITTELLLMGVATIWILPDDSESGYQLRVIPREWIKDTEESTNYAPDVLKIKTKSNAPEIKIKRDEFIQFRMYSPGMPGGWQSPIAALRQTLTEQVHADRFRTEVWRSSGRFNAYIQRPANVQPWDDETRKKFVTAFRETWGRGGENAGKMPLLEDGMEIKPYQFNAKEAQYAETKQLSREDVAAAYHVNPSLIWHTTTQTYASAKDNARALYADCLGPMIQMIQQRVNAFLLPMIGSDPSLYVEFDLTEKLKGSFEERASILQASVGGPWLTRNEARADNNLPPIDGGDELIVPLNVITGGQASPQDTHMNQDSAEPEVKAVDVEVKSASDPIRIKARSSEEEDAAVAEVLEKFYKRQRNSILPKIGSKAAEWFDMDRWNKELADDLEPVVDSIADAHGKETAELIGMEYGVEQTRAYLRKLSEGRANAINTSTEKKLTEAIDDDESDPADVFDDLEENGAKKTGAHIALAVAGFGMLEACHQAQDQGEERTIEKMWITGDNPRPTHAAMNGETVGIDDPFSNGALWPGDDNLDPDESCGCNCTTEVIMS